MPTSGDFEYEIYNNVATITGYLGTGGSVTVPSTLAGLSVAEIGNYTFAYNNAITSVSIPSSVTSIGYKVFYNCPSLTSIVVSGQNLFFSSYNDSLYDKTESTLICYPASKAGPVAFSNNVTSIGDDAFTFCQKLESVTIPTGVVTIGENVFESSIGLNSVIIPDSVTSIGSSAFSYCHDLESVTLSNNITSINAYTFYECSKLKDIFIPNTVTNIGSYAFENCTSLTNITLPNNITSISDGMLNSCESLTSITIPASVTSISEQALDGCTSLAQINVAAANLVYSSFDDVLYDKSQNTLILYPLGKVTPVNFPGTLKSIASSAFYSCLNITSITIPEGVESIGDFAFTMCANLTSITIPSTVTAIGIYEFYGCTALTSIDVDSQNTVYSSFDGALYNKPVTTLLFYPEGKTGSVILPDTLESIVDFGFANCAGLTTITIPSSVTSINKKSFFGCANLASILVVSENTVYSSFDGALYDKSQKNLLTYPSAKSEPVTFPSSVEGISSFGFYYCTGLTTITIPSSITSIGDNAFLACSNLATAKFFGDAPMAPVGIFGGVAPNFKVYYYAGKSGYTPNFLGYPSVPFYTVAYNGNGNNGGAVPEDGNTYLQGETVQVLYNTGDLIKPGYSFMGWNTSPDGRGNDIAIGTTFSMGTEHLLLYAKWYQDPQKIKPAFRGITFY
ncbi:leucine-rich repeat domain-containing protein [Clostridium sp. YIM B02551]|uniref:leucine-rich repeat domain-containing protein n=1 Tax=Clostridium sp. YIM B02551 TaxID=2910679 RepID=UPI001EEB151F|nr:leucine-rich repeat domain-containing protein [Clostridium sp. YIM B02551]